MDNVSKKERYAMYTFLCIIYFSFAFHMNIIGSVLKDLAVMLNCSLEDITFGLSLRTIMNFVAGLVATLSMNIFNRQLQFGFYILIYGLCALAMPFLVNVNQYYALSVISGVSIAYINAISIVWVIELFQKSARINTFIQVFYLFFSLSGLASFLINAPLLSNKINDSTLSDEFSKNITSTSTNHTASQIYIPYMIAFVLLCSCSMGVFYLYFRKPYQPPIRTLDGKDCKSIDLNSIDNKTVNPIPSYYYYLVTIFFLLCVAFELGAESNMINYTQTYLTGTNLNLSKASAAYIVSITLGAYTAGRIINCLVAFKMKIHHMIYINLSLLIISNLLICLFIEMHINIAYIAFLLLGFGYSSMYPCLIAFFEQRMNLTNKVSTLMTTASTAIALINHLIMGYNLSTNYRIYKYMSATYTLVLVCIFAALHCTDFLKYKLSKTSKSTKSEENQINF